MPIRTGCATDICRRLFLAALLAVSFCGWAQNPTLNQNTREGRDKVVAHRVLVIPFEPRLYMSEIDRQINAETGLAAKQIKHRFRDGINEQVCKSLKADRFGAIDLMEDTSKSRKDLHLIYQNLHYEYLKVPDQQNYQVPQKTGPAKPVEKGQLVVETNSDERFMDARLEDLKLLATLKSKHKTDLFLFINQMDLQASGSKAPGEIGDGNPNRRIVLHYTLLNSQGRELNSGTVVEDFEPTLNNPKKIIDKHFSVIGKVLTQRIVRSMGPAR